MILYIYYMSGSSNTVSSQRISSQSLNSRYLKQTYFFAVFSTLGTTIYLGFFWTQKPMGFTRSMTLNDP